jgi:hypothetical protein
MASLFNCRTFADSQTTTARNLARDLIPIVRRTLLNQPNLISMPETMRSLLSQVIEPSLSLAKRSQKPQLLSLVPFELTFLKIQCASSCWRFGCSKYWRVPPGRLAHSLPEFVDNITDFQCINLSAHRKTLRPQIDLAT